MCQISFGTDNSSRDQVFRSPIGCGLPYPLVNSLNLTFVFVCDCSLLCIIGIFFLKTNWCLVGAVDDSEWPSVNIFHRNLEKGMLTLTEDDSAWRTLLQRTLLSTERGFLEAQNCRKNRRTKNPLKTDRGWNGWNSHAPLSLGRISAILEAFIWKTYIVIGCSTGKWLSAT